MKGAVLTRIEPDIGGGLHMEEDLYPEADLHMEAPSGVGFETEADVGVGFTYGGGNRRRLLLYAYIRGMSGVRFFKIEAYSGGRFTYGGRRQESEEIDMVRVY